MLPVSWETITLRARALSCVRRFFDGLGYTEVATRAVRGTTVSDPYIESFRTEWCGGGGPLYLQTSPEYAHKILLSHYRHPIYEIARVFRNEPHGESHRREFTLIEWYHPETDYAVMMDETEALVRATAEALGRTSMHSGARERGVAPIVLDDAPFERITVADAFMRYVGFSPIGMDLATLTEAARDSGCRVGDGWSWNDVANCVLVDHIEPHLGMDRPTFLTDYPATMASLAQTRPSASGPVAERFELYICGVELCNGYSELNDPVELAARFRADNAERESLGLPQIPPDTALLEALPSLGKLGGNALGFERLMMLCLDKDDIAEVMIDI